MAVVNPEVTLVSTEHTTVLLYFIVCFIVSENAFVSVSDVPDGPGVPSKD